MAVYLIQGSYAATSVGAMIKNPQDRSAVVRSMIEKAGGKLHGFWFALGEFDFVAVAEAPDNVSVAAIAMAVGATGSLSAYRTTPLMTTAESVEAMRKAGGTGYQPPR
ncbi:MAG: GYD domain-containing protein [Alphaproteobacteria bacterium]|nr:GYD domain-containing protein [Alphaproteobacteria bacterium]